MPDKEFSKVSPHRFERKPGEAPHIGKVARSPLSGVESARGTSKRELRKKKNSTVVVAWSGLFVFLTLCLLATAGVMFFKNQAETREAAIGDSRPTFDLESAFSNDNETGAPVLGQEKALRIVADALSNRDPVLFNDFFIPPEIGTPSEAIGDLERLASTEGEIQRMTWIGPKFSNGQVTEQVLVTTRKDGKEKNRLAQLVPGAGDSWLIDFDSYMRASSAGWEYILRGEAPVAKVRVFVAEDTYYNGIFSDETEWQAYSLVSPDVADILYGYCKKGSPRNRALKRILSMEEGAHRATLEIRISPDADARQFEISRVFAEGWVERRDAFDESF